MTETTIKSQLKKLVELQTIDTDIYKYREDLTEKPKVIESLKQEFESKKAHLNQLENNLKTVLLKRKERELELKTKEDEIAKANADLSKIKTNKEYTAKIAEIEHIKADRSIVEERILELFDEGDKVNAEIQKEKVVVAEHEKIYLSRKKEIDDQIRGIEGKVKELEAQRVSVIPEIDKNYLSRYDRILKNKHGLAIAEIKNNTCSGCHMVLNPQMINTVVINEQLVECDMCSRILYLKDKLD